MRDENKNGVTRVTDKAIDDEVKSPTLVATPSARAATQPTKEAASSVVDMTISKDVASVPADTPSKAPGRTSRQYRGLHKHSRSRFFCFSYPAKDGRWLHHSTGKTTVGEAKTEKNVFLAELERKGGQEPTREAQWTVERAADAWLEYRTATGTNAVTLRKERAVLAAVKREVGGLQLREITLATLRAYQVNRTRTVAPYTCNREIQFLARLMKEADCWDHLRYRYKPLRLHDSDVGRALTVEQGKLLLATAQSKPAWRVVGWSAMLALTSGLRGGEIKKLRLRSIHLDTDQPHIQVPRESTKTDSGARRVPLSATALWAATRLVEYAKMRGSTEPNHHLFPGALGRHTRPDDPLHGRTGYDPLVGRVSMRTAWRNLCTATAKHWAQVNPGAENPFIGLRFHTLRHTFITRAVEAGVPIEILMPIVGHLSPKMVRHYTHLSDSFLRKAVETVATATDIVLPDIEKMTPQSRAVN